MKHLVFYDENKRNQKEALRILSATGYHVLAPQTLVELASSTSSQDVLLYVLDLKGHQYLTEQDMLPGKIPSIILSKEGFEVIHPYLRSMPKFSNFISKDSEDRFSQRDLLCTVVKILRSDIFGIEKYLDWGAFSSELWVRDSNLRQDYINCQQQMVSGMNLRRSTTEAIQVVSEEFLMNAIYDAPTDEISGEQLYGNVERKNQIVLSPHQAVRYQIGADGKRIVVAVTDPFGSITKDKVIRFLAKCYGEEKKANLGQDPSTAGAGLGLFFCFNYVHSLIINVSPGIKTEFIGIIEIDSKLKSSQKSKTHFHFFKLNESDHFS